MRRLVVAYIATSLIAPASGQDGLPSIFQHATGPQIAENAIDIGRLESLTDAYMSQMLNFASTGNLSQIGSNAINSVVYRGDLRNVVQRFDGTQSVDNRLALGLVDIFGDISQSGKNLAGSTVSNSLEFADQLLGADGQQLVLNSAEIAILYGSVGQSGINMANYAEATLAIGSASQIIELGAVQHVDNRLEVAAMSAVSAAISQRGENFGNIMISETVDSLTRNFAGDQKVHNVVVLGEGEAGSVTQHGTNMANFIMASRIGALEQISVGTQSVVNEVLDAQGNAVTGGGITQTSDNSVNVIILTQPAEGGDDATILVAQTADFPQSANSSGGGAQTGNALVVDR
ncbi:hypothetical protein SAMN05428969_1344 [Devosia sp. YR412]|uniref:hypothetical protein n=1 Tax=Devosia sp. YR412 TaxID=1881030 RepID=UPI0008C62AB6|nr:hypothetical protein [Devosia sp. YR412]SEP97071.1 hypothetical protein SAMN05428969_1344 [Devosia sp. YR412]